MKALILGDTHGNTQAAIKASIRARQRGAKIIVQCGDFGLWDHFYDGVEFLDKLNEQLGHDRIKLVWTDGNHENHDRLEWYVQNNPKSKNGHTYIRSNILYSPRGHYWTWDNKKFMTVGGAVSIDKDYRLGREQWGEKPSGDRTLYWPNEQLTDEQVSHIIKTMDARRVAGKQGIDYLFTHDCSNKTPFRDRLKPDIDSQIHRQRMDEVLKAVRPKMQFHGHMHTKYEWDNWLDYDGDEPIKTFGLECDGMFWNWGILDTETDTFEFAPTLLEKK